MKASSLLLLCLLLLPVVSNLYAQDDSSTLAQQEDLLMLSAHVYDLEQLAIDMGGVEQVSNHAIYDPTDPAIISSNKWGTWPEAGDWTVINYKDNLFSGLTVAVYKNELKKELVIAFAGTGGGGNDIESDFREDLKLVNPVAGSYLFSDAKLTLENYIPQYSSQYSDYSVRFTGHSLGGAMAQFAGVMYGLETVTFNTAPFSLSQNTRSLLTDEAEYRLYYSDGSDSFITNIRAANDYVSYVAIKLKPITAGSSMPGHTVTLESYMTGHTIAEMIRQYSPDYKTILVEATPVTSAYNSYTTYIKNKNEVMLAVGGQIINTGYVLKDVVVEGAKNNIIASVVVNNLDKLDIAIGWLGEVEFTPGYSFKDYFGALSQIYSVTQDVVFGIPSPDMDLSSGTISSATTVWPTGHEEALLVSNIGKLAEAVGTISEGTQNYTQGLVEGGVVNILSDIVAGAWLKLAKYPAAGQVLHKINKATIKKRVTERVTDSLYLNDKSNFSSKAMINGMVTNLVIEIVADVLGEITGKNWVRGASWFVLKEAFIAHEAFYGCEPVKKCGPMVSKVKLAILQAELLGAVIQKDVQEYKQLISDVDSKHRSKINGLLMNAASVVDIQYGPDVVSYYRVEDRQDLLIKLEKIKQNGRDAIASYVNPLHSVWLIQDPDEVKKLANLILVEWESELEPRLEQSRLNAQSYIYRLLADGNFEQAEETVLRFGTVSDVSNFALSQYQDRVLSMKGFSKQEIDHFVSNYMNNSDDVDYVYDVDNSYSHLYMTKEFVSSIGDIYDSTENLLNVLMAVKVEGSDRYDVIPFTSDNYKEVIDSKGSEGYLIALSDQYFTSSTKITIALFDPKLYEYAIQDNPRYLDGAIDQGYVADAEGELYKSAIVFEVDRALEGTVKARQDFTSTGAPAETFLEITFPEITGRSVIEGQYAFNALAGDEIVLRQRVGRTVETSVAECWMDAPEDRYAPEYSFKTYKVWLRDYSTGDLFSVDATRSSDCQSLIFSPPSEGGWMLKQYTAEYENSSGEKKVLGGNFFANKMVVGEPDGGDVSSEGNQSAQSDTSDNLINDVALKPLNDTGITRCGNASSNDEDCPVADYPGQDGEYTTAGRHGHSFSKLDHNGTTLPDSATEWSCIKDNVTNLTWEVKTDDSGLHDKDDRYNWYNTDATTNGGAVGYADDDGNICTGYNSSDATSYCNTEAYVARVNAAGLCGASDWYLPEREQLRTIVDYSRYNPSINQGYFPNTKSSYYWSSSPDAGGSAYAWDVYFNDGYDYRNNKNYDEYVRLVRGGQ